MDRLLRVAFLAPVLLLPSACGGDEEESASGPAIAVSVDGRIHRFPNVRTELQAFLGDSWLLDVGAGRGFGDLSFAFFTDITTAAGLSGKTLVNDYREHNPDRHPIEDILNFVRVGGKEYQGHRVEGIVRAVSDRQITLEVRGTFLEFPADWDETEGDTVPTGREVQVSATFTGPLKVESR